MRLSRRPRRPKRVVLSATDKGKVDSSTQAAAAVTDGSVVVGAGSPQRARGDGQRT